MTWQPIDTAPKDGRQVLLGRFVSKCKMNGRVRVDWYRQPNDSAGYLGWGEFNMTYWPPTHWHELPEPPK